MADDTPGTIARLLDGPNVIAKWLGIALSASILGGAIYTGKTINRIEAAERTISENGTEIDEHERRVTTLEADERAISKSLEEIKARQDRNLDEIKGDLGKITDKLDRIPRYSGGYRNDGGDAPESRDR